jgi:hypothetical protein
MATIRRWASFGRAGVPTETVRFALASDESTSFPAAVERTVDAVWEAELVGDHYDGTLLNLRSVESADRTVALEPVPYRHYAVRNYLLSNPAARGTYDAGEETVARLRDSIHVLSSFVLVLTGDHAVLGARRPGWRGRDRRYVSCPGSGYLSGTEDVAGGEVRPAVEVVLREVREELNVGSPRETMRSFGVFEEVGDETDYNPALFSLLRSSRSFDEIRERWRTAEDRSEFEDLLALPLTEDAVEETVRRGFPADAKPDHRRERLASGSDETALTPKAAFALLLVGRRRFGSEWYRSLLESVGTAVIDGDGL